MVLDNGQMGIHARKKCIALGFDPGRDKIGFAVVNLDGELLLSGIFRSEEYKAFFDAITSNPESLSEWAIEGNFHVTASQAITDSLAFIAVGNGTHSKSFLDILKANLECEILIVDEKNTTLEARNLYWKIHSPNFWIKLLPKGLRVPNRILDDLAAWSIALRGVKKYRDISRNKL